MGTSPLSLEGKGEERYISLFSPLTKALWTLKGDGDGNLSIIFRGGGRGHTVSPFSLEAKGECTCISPLSPKVMGITPWTLSFLDLGFLDLGFLDLGSVDLGSMDLGSLDLGALSFKGK